MNAPLAPIQVKLVLQGSLRAAVADLDADTFERFEQAWVFAERQLGGGAQALSGPLNYLVPCAGMILAIRFDAQREQFMIVAFADLGDGPTPDGRLPATDNFVEVALDVLGANPNAPSGDAWPTPPTFALLGQPLAIERAVAATMTTGLDARAGDAWLAVPVLAAPGQPFGIERPWAVTMTTSVLDVAASERVAELLRLLIRGRRRDGCDRSLSGPAPPDR